MTNVARVSAKPNHSAQNANEAVRTSFGSVSTGLRRLRPNFGIVRRDNTPLNVDAQNGLSDLLHGIERLRKGVRPRLKVEWLRGRVYLVSSNSWRLRFSGDGQVLRFKVTRAPRGAAPGRRVLEARPECHYLEASDWFAWIFHVLLSRKSAWPTWAEFCWSHSHLGAV
jgi:hypothetical protein